MKEDSGLTSPERARELAGEAIGRAGEDPIAQVREISSLPPEDFRQVLFGILFGDV